MERGVDFWVVDAELPFEQRLRADGAEQRDLRGGGHDPPDAEASCEGSMNLTEHAPREGSLNMTTANVPAQSATSHESLLDRYTLPFCTASTT